ncbi:MAG: segregation/condensation protein A [Bdellovibrionales bacterium]|nr:segregation/condensation protein A [Bdellovibrionales bacterium]
MSVHIQLDRFEGPLGLLLYLIRKDEMDIFDIDIHRITEQYLEYVKTMKELNLEVAGEFVAMAATLIHIKSKMLLPNYDENGEEEETLDPRKELVQRLLEYQKFQEVSQKLYDRPLLDRDVYSRGEKLDLSKADVEEEIVLEENPLFSLIKAYRWAVKNMKKGKHRVVTELQSIAERISEFRHRLVVGRRTRFNELLDHAKLRENEGMVGHVLITFLSLLELGKMGFVSLFQSEPCGEIHVQAKSQIDEGVIDSARNFEVDYSYKVEEVSVEEEEEILDLNQLELEADGALS